MIGSTAGTPRRAVARRERARSYGVAMSDRARPCTDKCGPDTDRTRRGRDLTN
ncbi:hypothetical protein [Streptomyces sp. UNOC14_S4]|uniref:hypothetical protein n=1 Tax=Streptomyces sp. UNOC14_S4 TaxID=2872340 RepID=UPI001E351334|nr:hypothetical protein [Streptomyces sp. UNOC14_S4]MCC3767944.1 hypothetical protein [Streptomyces sp. UNOC14_S4]